MTLGYFLSSEEWGPTDLVPGSGEALDEHIFGDRWPGADERLEMLEEASPKIIVSGFDEVYINQIGPDQDGFFAAYREHVLPRF
jgi:hypothetical protein